MAGQDIRIGRSPSNRHLGVCPLKPAPASPTNESSSVPETKDSLLLQSKGEYAPNEASRSPDPSPPLKAEPQVESTTVPKVSGSSKPVLSFESGAAGASLLTDIKSESTNVADSGPDFHTDNVTRSTVGWAGDPTLTPPLGQSHRRLIAQGMAYMDKVAPGYRQRLDLLVDANPDPERAAHCQKLNDEQNQLFQKHGALLAHPEAYVKKEMPDKLEQHQGLNKRIANIHSEWESTQGAIDSLERKNLLAARDLSGDFLSKLRSQNAEGESQNVSEAILLGSGAQKALKDQGIEIDSLKNWVNEFHHQTGLPKPKKLEFRHTGPRPQYWAQEDYVNLGDNFGKRWLLHEVAHRAEYSNPEVSLASKDWIRARALAAGNSGTVGSRLKDITGSDFYDKEEIAVEDHFVSPYVGKLYPDAATEVLSVGLEHFDDPGRMLQLYRRDPEHFFLVLGSLETLKKSGW